MECKQPQVLRRAASSELYLSARRRPNSKRNSRDLTSMLVRSMDSEGSSSSRYSSAGNGSGGGGGGGGNVAVNTRLQSLRKNHLSRSSGCLPCASPLSSSLLESPETADSDNIKQFFSLTDIRSTELAKALTLVEFEMFEKLNPIEFLQRIKWFPVVDNDSAACRNGSDEKTCAIEKMISRFNEVGRSAKLERYCLRLTAVNSDQFLDANGNLGVS